MRLNYDREMFFVSGKPVPKARPRTMSRGGKSITYTPKATREWESLVRDTAALEMRGRKPLDGPLEVSMQFWMPAPASWSNKKRDAVGGMFHVKKPDVDNLAKAVLDGMESIVFERDSQVAKLTVSKRYALDHSEPRHPERLRPNWAGPGVHVHVYRLMLS